MRTISITEYTETKTELIPKTTFFTNSDCENNEADNTALCVTEEADETSPGGKRQYHWTLSRLDADSVQVTVADSTVTTLGTLALPDPFGDSTIDIIPLPDADRVVISLAAGQDGSQDYCVQFDGRKLTTAYEFPPELTYMFSVGNHVVCADFYDEKLAALSYPDFTCEIEKELQDLDETCLTNIWKITDSIAVMCTDAGRFYAITIPTLEVIGEIVITGHEPQPDELGINSSNISSMKISDDEVIFNRFWFDRNAQQLATANIHVGKEEFCTLISSHMA